MKELLQKKTYIGHNKWSTDIAPFTIGIRSEVTVLDVHYTEIYLSRMLLFIYNLVKHNGHILFISTDTNKANIESININNIVQHIANTLGFSYCTRRWIGGTLTNWKQVVKKSNINSKNYPTKNGLSLTGKFPDLIIVLNPYENRLAIEEANKLQIPVIGLLDSDSKSLGIDYVVPVNDDSEGFIYMFLGCITKAVKLARLK
jgi:small subunit ribosomal protein S2